MTNNLDILIAEDSRTQAELLRHLLETHGYKVTVALNGKDAVDAARRSKPRLILSDIEMPVMDGYEMCRVIKHDPNLRDVPVILLTSLSDPEDILKGLEAKADYYLTKPYDGNYLLSRVHAVITTPVKPKLDSVAEGLEVTFGGKQHVVEVDRQQVLNLLLSIYEGAIQKNRELIRTQTELKTLNDQLVETARSERNAHETLKRAQSQLVQSEKLAGLGQMVAGVAHEINNPLSFVSNNVAVMQRDLAGILKLLDFYKSGESSLAKIEPELLDQVHELCDRIDLPYTTSNLQGLLLRSRDGLNRIQQIVKDLRDFARLDESDLSEVDINAGIESTVNIIHSSAVSKNIQIKLDLQPLPRITCYPAKINQVIMNLLSNAIDASDAGGSISVRSRKIDGAVEIEVSDRGRGIDPTVRPRIFDPFFTTKPLGMGTGLGLSISYGIIEQHKGKISVESTVGEGSRFTVLLPITSIDRTTE